MKFEPIVELVELNHPTVVAPYDLACKRAHKCVLALSLIRLLTLCSAGMYVTFQFYRSLRDDTTVVLNLSSRININFRIEGCCGYCEIVFLDLRSHRVIFENHYFLLDFGELLII